MTPALPSLISLLSCISGRARQLILAALALLGLAACDGPPEFNYVIEGKELEALYVGKTFAYQRPDGLYGEYFAPNGQVLTRLPNGARTRGFYVFKNTPFEDAQVCFIYDKVEGEHCWVTYTTNQPGTYAVRGVEGGFYTVMQLVGAGNKL